MFLKPALQTTLLLICLVWQVYSGNRERQVWDHHRVLDNKGKYQLYFSADKNTVTFQVEVITQGWVGFGISPDMNFEGSDLIIGGVKNGKEYFVSYKVEEHGKLQPSTSWTMMSASETKGRTVLKFRTKLHTCNPESWIIPGETHNIFYAYSEDDFSSPDKNRINSNKTWTRKMEKLLQPRINQIEMPDDIIYVDFLMGNYSVPGNRDSLYGCRILKGPQLKRKHHIIKVTPVIQQDNIEIVHHLFWLKCTISAEEGERQVSEGSNECIYGDSFITTGNCVTYNFGWGRGGGPNLYPTKLGMPFGENPDEYYMLQIHYDNPTFLNGIVDNSGIRVYYTPNLRKHDAGIFLTGINIMSGMVIPPGQREFIVAGHSPPGCFTAITKEEIRVFSVLLHAHLIGRKVKLRHFRNGKELRTIAMDNHYDHHYQEFIYFSEDLIILPGDQLITECTFDSSSRNYTTFGRERTIDEMCLSNVLYYPKLSLFVSQSDISRALIGGLTGMDLTGGVNSIRDAFTRRAGFDRYLVNYDWPQELICLVENAQRFAPQDSICQTNDTRVTRPLSITYPEGVKPFRIPSVCPESLTVEDRCSRYI